MRNPAYRKAGMGLAVFALALALLAIVCHLLQPPNPPTYIKEIGAYREGDGLAIWFALGDDQGRYTASAGMVNLEIIEETSEWEGWDLVDVERIVYRDSFEVERGDFQRTTVGQGAFERKVLLYAYGRVPRDAFSLAPDEFGMGTVRIVFTTPDGTRMELGESCVLPD